mmetsp:Transcript_9462/g.26408  ORF Transcript_9462/g.26408 Transcript_9462/m.26408 type:complete len:308 (+) Transcript_9462:303-1226(+)
MCKHLSDAQVHGIVQKSQVARKPHDLGQRPCCALHAPLPMPARTNMLLPCAVEEHDEELGVPAIRVSCPGPFEAAREGILAVSCTAEPRPRVFWLLTRRRARTKGTCAVSPAKGMAAANQGHRVHVMEIHTPEGVAYIEGAQCRIGVGPPETIHVFMHGTFRVQVNEAHCGTAKGPLARAIDSARRHSRLLFTRTKHVALKSILRVDPSCTILCHGTTHCVDRGGASQHEKVAPTESITILLFDRPEQGTCLVKVRVILPTTFWFKPLPPSCTSSTTISFAIGARAMPRKTDEEGAVVTPVRGPARL